MTPSPPFPGGRIRRQRIGWIASFAGVAALAGVVVGVLSAMIDGHPPPGPVLRGGLIGLLIGAGMGVGEAVVVPRLSRRIGFFLLNAARVASYGALILASVLLVNTVHRWAFHDLGILEAVASLMGASAARDLGVSPVLGFLRWPHAAPTRRAEARPTSSTGF